MPKSDAFRVRIDPIDREGLDAIRAWLAERRPDPAMPYPTESDAIRVAIRRMADSVQTLENSPKKNTKRNGVVD